jgi:ATP synthase F1 complex assembly factor 2
LNLDQVKVASRLEEEFQVEIWGVVEGGHDMDRLNNAVSLSSAGVFMRLLWDEKTHAKKMDAFASL